VVSTFEVGRTYRSRFGEGADFTCTERRFAGVLGELELVTLHNPVLGALERTARTVAGDVFPRVTETLGGALRSDCCDHRGWPGELRRVVANAGPNAGRRCCTSCGGFVGRLRIAMPNHCLPAPPPSETHVPLCTHLPRTA
jgi:hypothetical protein